ncbi:MAG: response regulator [Fibrobacter sp.]|nr:response regulator [Fibrobacter sp.]
MKNFEKNRTRLLVICQKNELTCDLVTLLTGYGYFVDYVESLTEGVTRFKEYKHTIVIVDSDLLPKRPKELFAVFKYYTVNPKILIIAGKSEEEAIYPYLDHGIYDIIQVPLRFRYLHYKLRKLVVNDSLISKYEYYQFLIQLMVISSPIWVNFIISLTRNLL